MNKFKKRKAIKEGKIIVDHGDNDIRIYRTPKDLINMGQDSEEKETTNREQRTGKKQQANGTHIKGGTAADK